MTDLSKRAVACGGWRWMDGMLWWWGDGPHSIERWRVVESDSVEMCGYSPTQSKSWGLFSDGHDGLAFNDPGFSALPDLADPATLGCLLYLVREAWGDPDLLWSGRIEVHQDQHSIFRVVQPYHDAGGALRYACLVSGATEAEALVVALEAS